MTDQNSAALRYVRFVLQHLGISPGALAKQAGIAPSTLTRFLNSSDHKFNLSTTTIEKIVRVSGVSPASFYETAERNLLSSEIGPQTGNRYLNATTNRSIPVIGEVSPGTWRDRLIDKSPNFLDPVYIVPTSYSHDSYFACLVRGNECAPIANDGDYLLCVERDAFLSTHNFAIGDLVIVETLSEDGKLSELSARPIRRTKIEFVLGSISGETASNRLRLPERIDEAGPVRILGVVSWAVRDVWNMSI